jgi:hypothetical protein
MLSGPSRPHVRSEGGFGLRRHPAEVASFEGVGEGFGPRRRSEKGGLQRASKEGFGPRRRPMWGTACCGRRRGLRSSTMSAGGGEGFGPRRRPEAETRASVFDDAKGRLGLRRVRTRTSVFGRRRAADPVSLRPSGRRARAGLDRSVPKWSSGRGRSGTVRSAPPLFRFRRRRAPRAPGTSRACPRGEWRSRSPKGRFSVRRGGRLVRLRGCFGTRTTRLRWARWCRVDPTSRGDRRRRRRTATR